MRTALIVVAAGTGERLRAGIDKPYVEVCGRPLVWHCLRRLDADDLFSQRIVVVAPGTEARFRQRVLGAFPLTQAVDLVAGGATRRASVANGLRALRPEIELVAIHDGARPCIDARTVRATIAACEGVDGAVVALPVHDALKRVSGDLVAEDVDRSGLWRAQTPQTFHVAAITAAHTDAERQGIDASDDVTLVLRRGGQVRVVEGSRENLKVTEPGDLRLASMLLGDSPESALEASDR